MMDQEELLRVKNSPNDYVLKRILVEHIHKESETSKDSIDIGTPAKGGHIKIYCNFDDLEVTKAKINNAIKARSYAQSKLDVVK